MNAEALIGTVLGTCTLQKLVGQGGMGAVFLAQQSRPKRQVAVKVLLPMRALTPNQLTAFLERFRRETDAAASMEHPNIMPVHEYGERKGLAYLVMPYVSGGTLRDELERCDSLPLEKVTNYLEQIAAAIDFAHEHGVIHRDIKPANIMVTEEGRLLLADFGLVKIVAEGQTPQIRITGAGAPVGTPDYMSPEQVIGEEVTTRADLYSLGVILYQMVTGTTPFRGETPMQIAAQHLQTPPPSAQMMRPDLPVAADQVIQCALAKRPAERYTNAKALADAFRIALIKAGVQLDASYYTHGLPGTSTTGRFAVPKGQFDPIRQTASLPRVSKPALESHNTDKRSAVRTEARDLPIASLSLQPSQLAAGCPPRTQLYSIAPISPFPSIQPDASLEQGGGGLLSRTGKFPRVGTGSIPAVRRPASQIQGGGLLSSTGKYVASGRVLPTSRTAGLAAAAGLTPQTQDNMRSPTGSLPTVGQRPGQQAQAAQESTDMMKSSSPMKVVKIPMTGQPGQFVTGLLPLAANSPISAKGRPQTLPLQDPIRDLTLTPRMKIALLVAAILLIAAGLAGFLWFTHHAHTSSQGAVLTLLMQNIYGNK